MDWTALDFEKLANAIVILVTGVAIAFGFRGGKRAPATSAASSSQVELAGAIVDSSSVLALAGELAGQALAITAQTAAVKEQALATDRHRHAIDDLTEQVKELRQAMGRR